MEKSMSQKFSENFKNIPPSFVRELLSVADQKSMISFAGGLPKPELFPLREIEESAMAVLCESGRTILQYAGSQGYMPLREWIANRYNRMYQMQIRAENVVITNGSQQAIDVVTKMMIDQGDGLVVEKPTYLGAIQATSAYRPKYLGVDLHEDGPDLNQFEHYCKKHRPKFFYGIPTFQNPSGIRYPLKSRMELAELLKKHDLMMMEDDPYHEIVFDGKTLPPVFHFAPNHVIWTGSFSKMVAPGLRMGWVVVPEGWANHFVKAKQSTDLHTNNLTQYILHHYLTHNNIDEHLMKIQNAYELQCNFMKEMISAHMPIEVKQTNPHGGMFIWLTLPPYIDSEELIKNCIKNGVAFVPGKSFYVNGQGRQNIRMNFSNASFENIEKGVKVIGEEMYKVLQNAHSYV